MNKHLLGAVGERHTTKAVLLLANPFGKDVPVDQAVDFGSGLLIRRDVMAYEIKANTPGYFYANVNEEKVMCRLYEPPADVKVPDDIKEFPILVGVPNEDKRILLAEESYEELASQHRIDEVYRKVRELSEVDQDFAAEAAKVRATNIADYEGDTDILIDDLEDLYNRWTRNA